MNWEISFHIRSLESSRGSPLPNSSGGDDKEKKKNHEQEQEQEQEPEEVEINGLHWPIIHFWKRCWKKKIKNKKIKNWIFPGNFTFCPIIGTLMRSALVSAWISFAMAATSSPHTTATATATATTTTTTTTATTTSTPTFTTNLIVGALGR